MKKLIAFVLLLSGLSMAQTVTKLPGQIPADANYKPGSVILMQDTSGHYVRINAQNPLPVNATVTATVGDVAVKGVAALGNGNLTVGTTAAQVSSTPTGCKWVSVINNTSGATVYVGTSTVSSTNGYAVLKYGDSMTIGVDNLNKVYVISSQALTDVRYLYGN